ncbi:MarR family winged helix-turn-helix transcriptional regulator [Methanococcoides alaskense]|uniref:DNA-binding MarR family transcriptional regulator n=1 Tax=Methanococcoides alaskense TaxID=325778 RepID=A0AA90Z9F0_9EURY|nr:MarR family transcriptional regulator [Methanococcoides alaskense]MDR6223386.1 DNA-binding MarR family transcriptional regulator [Methanococcoides alaskense]
MMEEQESQYNPMEIAGPITMLSRSKIAYMSRELKPYGFGWGDYDFLMMLYYRKEGVSQENLAKSLTVSKTTSMRAIKKLESEGYIFRKQDENDRRAYKVYLTEKGKAIQETIWQKLADWDNMIFSEFSSEERDNLKLLLKKACDPIYSEIGLDVDEASISHDPK